MDKDTKGLVWVCVIIVVTFIILGLINLYDIHKFNEDCHDRGGVVKREIDRVCIK